MIDLVKMLEEFFERLKNMSDEELQKAIEQAHEDSKDSWIFEGKE